MGADQPAEVVDDAPRHLVCFLLCIKLFHLLIMFLHDNKQEVCYLLRAKDVNEEIYLEKDYNYRKGILLVSSIHSIITFARHILLC